MLSKHQPGVGAIQARLVAHLNILFMQLTLVYLVLPANS